MPALSKQRPTILQIIPQLDTGGAELSTLEITDALSRAGALALVASEGGRLSDQVGHLGGELISFPAATKNPLKLRRNSARLAALMRDRSVDLIHARSRAPAWSALWAARRIGVPFVVTYHGAYNESNSLKKFYNSVMARGDVVIANSRYTAQLIKDRYATPDERLRVIHRGVDLLKFDPTKFMSDRKKRLLSQWGVTGNKRIVLNAARLTGWKGQRVIISAASELALASRLDDAMIILAGDAQSRDAYLQELEQLIRAKGLSEYVRIVGHCDDMPAAFALAHVAVVASTEPEAFGRAAAEAQAMACPVISTNIGAPPETVRALPAVNDRDTTGWLIEPNNVAELARCLTAALELKGEERAALGERARQHVQANFSSERMKISTLAVYDGLLDTKLSYKLYRPLFKQ